MAGSGNLSLLQFIRGILAPGVGDAADEQALRRFADSRDDEAFASLVVRHGPLVLHVCKQLLDDPEDVEDAFQSTFLVLVRRAGSIRRPERLAGWLYGVAHRVATRVRIRIARRRSHESSVQGLEETAALTRSAAPEDWHVLHEEVNRLPEKFRLPIILCYFQGLTRQQAAGQLGWTEGAVKGCLERGRALLRNRLVRHSASLAALVSAAAQGAEMSALPGPYLSSTLDAAAQFANATSQTREGISQNVVSLTEEVLATMNPTKLIMAVASLVLLAALIPGAWLYAHFRTPINKAGKNPANSPAVQNKKKPAPAELAVAMELQPFQGVWKMNTCDSVNKRLYAPQKEVWNWRWTVKGDKILWARQGEEWKMTLKVDPAKSPKEIDLIYLSGPFKGVKCLGMYKWGGVDGKSLMISIQDPGANVPRPKSISMTSNSRTSLMFLRRTKPIDPMKEIASLQGTWTFEAVQTDAWPRPIGKGPDKSGRGSERRWAVTGNEISWIGRDGKRVKAAFTIDPRKVPKHIDFTFLSGTHKGKKCPGVYKRGGLANKVLYLCMADPGSNTARPKNFSYETNAGRSLIILYPFTTAAKE